jgi:hypothetical protein
MRGVGREIIARFSSERLAQLQAANLARPTIDDLVFKLGDDGNPDDAKEFLEALENYLKSFAAPRVEERNGRARHLCICCDREISGLLLGTFVYAIAHGEGYCYECGWGYRRNHYLGDWCSWVQILPYHPEVSRVWKEVE